MVDIDQFSQDATLEYRRSTNLSLVVTIGEIMTPAVTENVPLQEGFTQVCVWPATTVGDSEKERAGFVKWIADEFGTRAQYLEEIVTASDDTGPGGRSDLFFAVHTDDIGKFAVPRLVYGIRWIEDMLGNHQGHLYPARVVGYKSWNIDSAELVDG